MARGYPVISGKIGPVVVCHIKATNSIIYRSRPRRYKQTAGTKAAQNSFGIASRAGKVLRRNLVTIMPFPKDKKLQSKFSGEITKWLKTTSIQNLNPINSIPFLKSFAFNEECPVDRRLNVDLLLIKEDNGTLLLKIPAIRPLINISTPAGTVVIECKIAAAGCLLKTGKEAGHFEKVLKFPYNDQQIPPQDISLGIDTLPGTLVVCGIYLVYYIKKSGMNIQTNNINFMPAGLVGAIYC